MRGYTIYKSISFQLIVIETTQFFLRKVLDSLPSSKKFGALIVHKTGLCCWEGGLRPQFRITSFSAILDSRESCNFRFYSWFFFFMMAKFLLLGRLSSPRLRKIGPSTRPWAECLKLKFRGPHLVTEIH